MIESRVSVPIELGDLILVDSYPAIYIGQGKGTIQFYRLWQLSALYEVAKNNRSLRIRKKTIGVLQLYRIVKYTPELLNDEWKKIYINAMEGLQLLMKHKKK